MGNVGSAERMNYTVLGNSVNLAARLEGLNKEYGTTILVSEAVRNRVEHCFRFKAIASVIAKGMTTETRVYELVEAAPEDPLAARHQSPRPACGERSEAAPSADFG